MKNILIVDDEESLLLIIASRFKNCRGRFTVFTALNGKEAIKILETQKINIVVTDLKMPVMDGFKLLIYMSNNFPSIPVIVNTAYSNPEIQLKLDAIGAIRVLDKAVDFDLLLEVVMQELQDHPSGSIRGISTSGFLQLIEVEHKTCLLEVQSAGQTKGLLYIVKGDLYDATCGDLSGEDAAYKVIGWKKVQLSLKELPTNKIKKRIKKKTMAVVMESMRRVDETEIAMKSQPDAPDETAPKSAAKTETTVTSKFVQETLETDDDFESALPAGEEDTFSREVTDILDVFNESSKPEKQRNTSEKEKVTSATTEGEGDTSIPPNRTPLSGNLSKKKIAQKTVQQIAMARGVSSNEMGKMLKFALERIRTILNVEAANLYLRENEQIKIAMASDAKARSMEKVQFKVGQGIAGRGVAMGKAIMLNDAKKLSRFYREIHPQTDHIIRSALCTPLLSHGRIVGVVEVLNKIEGDFDAEDEKILKPISVAIAEALQHFQTNSRTPTTSA
ncbi:MAG: response regulator [Thermodesulfobacteriota bacterium]|nr:response regulator [Thermodesulfobacteriota bacterium]